MSLLLSPRSAWLLASLLLLTTAARAQAPAWQAAVAVAPPTTNAASVVNATAVDSAGNVYVAGSFTGTVAFGATSFTSNSGDDAFVAKWHPVTGWVWAQRIGGPESEIANALVVRGASVYVTGSFYSPSLTIGSTTLANADPSGSPGSADIFVAKLTDAGPSATWTWAQRAGGVGPGSSSDDANALAVSGPNVYVAGNYNSPTADFGTTSITNHSQISVYDGFVAKLTDAGPSASWTWVHGYGGDEYDQTYALAVSGSSVYVGGFFESRTMAFGAATLHLTGFFLNGYAAKLIDAGPSSAWSWAENVGGAANATVHALAANGPSVYVAGSFTDPSITFGATTHLNAGIADAFVAKLTDTGITPTWTWSQRLGGIENDKARTLAVRGTSVYVAGQFRTTADFGPTTLTSAGMSDLFVTRLTDTGPSFHADWAQRAGGPQSDFAYALAVSPGTVYAAGNFNSGTASFGPLTLSCTAGAYAAGFLASLPDPTVLGLPADQSATLTLYPNPARTTVRLTTTAPIPTATLLDALGRPLRTFPLTADATTLDVSALPAGLYGVRVGPTTRRLVIE